MIASFSALTIFDLIAGLREWILFLQARDKCNRMKLTRIGCGSLRGVQVVCTSEPFARPITVPTRLEFTSNNWIAPRALNLPFAFQQVSDRPSEALVLRGEK
jgi:hypothetical protein